jgi:protein-disulfide isomerase
MVRTIPTLFVLALAVVALVGCPCDHEAASTTTTGGGHAVTAGGGGGGGVTEGGTGVVARIGDQEITYAQLDSEAASKLVRLRVQAWELRKQTLDELIDGQLMEAEAGTRGITVEELVQAEITDKVVEPTDEEALAYFEANPPRGDVEFDRIKPRVKAYMSRQAEQEARSAFIGGLREKSKVEVMLEPLRFEVGPGENNPTYGDFANAPIKIVEFSEFACPYCSRVNPTIDQVKETYGDKVALVFRDFPLPMHKDAPKAGEASHCANDQGKFWEMHDLMFANQRKLTPEDLKGYAAELALDEAAFAECLDSGKYADNIEADMADGAAVGVSGTPAFFINGQFINGARPFESFKEIIDAELKAKGLL